MPRLQRLAEVPAMPLWVINCVALRAIRPDRDIGHDGARGLCTLTLREQVRNRDALQLSYLAKLGWSPEACAWGPQHDDSAVVEQQFAVPDGPVAQLIAHALGETEDADQPVHRRGCVLVE